MRNNDDETSDEESFSIRFSPVERPDIPEGTLMRLRFPVDNPHGYMYYDHNRDVTIVTAACSQGCGLEYRDYWIPDVCPCRPCIDCKLVLTDSRPFIEPEC
jgi:hypothetical protein